MSNTLITLKDFYEQTKNLGKNDLILDVRNPDEFAAGHIKGATNIPVPVVGQSAQDLQKFDRVYIHCKRGGRAHTAYETLKAQGLNNLVCLQEAGFDLWIESGYPIEK
jgi:phage shock protein E